jgi:ABC-2 type transport system ATP-binding protein
MLCGLLPASSGHLEVAGVNLRTARAQARGRIGYVAQKFSCTATSPCARTWSSSAAPMACMARAARRIEATCCAIPPARTGPPSGELPGYKQRLAMAAGLLHEPEILFLDEPTSGIDPLARRAFWRTITALAAAGVTVIITTHFMEEAEYCDRIAIQDAGEVLAWARRSRCANRPAAGGADMNAAFIAIVERGRQRAAQHGSAG